MEKKVSAERKSKVHHLFGFMEVNNPEMREKVEVFFFKYCSADNTPNPSDQLMNQSTQTDIRLSESAEDTQSLRETAVQCQGHHRRVQVRCGGDVITSEAWPRRECKGQPRRDVMKGECGFKTKQKQTQTQRQIGISGLPLGNLFRLRPMLTVRDKGASILRYVHDPRSHVTRG